MPNNRTCFNLWLVKTCPTFWLNQTQRKADLAAYSFWRAIFKLSNRMKLTERNRYRHSTSHRRFKFNRFSHLLSFKSRCCSKTNQYSFLTGWHPRITSCGRIFKLLRRQTMGNRSPREIHHATTLSLRQRARRQRVIRLQRKIAAWMQAACNLLSVGLHQRSTI